MIAIETEKNKHSGEYSFESQYPNSPDLFFFENPTSLKFPIDLTRKIKATIINPIRKRSLPIGRFILPTYPATINAIIIRPAATTNVANTNFALFLLGRKLSRYLSGTVFSIAQFPPKAQ